MNNSFVKYIYSLGSDEIMAFENYLLEKEMKGRLVYKKINCGCDLKDFLHELEFTEREYELWFLNGCAVVLYHY